MSLGFPKSDLTKRKIWDYKVKCSSFYTPWAGGGGGRRGEEGRDLWRCFSNLPTMIYAFIAFAFHFKSLDNQALKEKDNKTRLL